MRRITLILFVISNMAAAQSWCPPEANWYFGFAYGNTNGYSKYSYIGDTLYEGQTAQVIAQEVHSYTNNPPEHVE